MWSLLSSFLANLFTGVFKAIMQQREAEKVGSDAQFIKDSTADDTAIKAATDARNNVVSSDSVPSVLQHAINQDPDCRD